jgi:multidrug efflux pump subunit AcrB
MNPAEEQANLLRQHGFKLVRQNTYFVFNDREGCVYVCSKMPSDFRAWKNALAVLKRIIAAPPPGSQIVEAERQQKQLEQYIQLHPAQKKAVGMQGSGRRKSVGTGIYTERPKAKLTVFVPTAEREARRLERDWDTLLRRVKTQRRELERDLTKLYNTAHLLTLLASLRVPGGNPKENRYGKTSD